MNGKIVVPISLCLLNAKDILKDFDHEAENFIFEDIKIHKLLVKVPENNILELTLMVPKGLLIKIIYSKLKVEKANTFHFFTFMN